jgi:hypothetical protein
LLPDIQQEEGTCKAAAAAAAATPNKHSTEK